MFWIQRIINSGSLLTPKPFRKKRNNTKDPVAATPKLNK